MNKKPRIKRDQEPAAPSARERKQERKEKMSKGVKIVLVAIGCLAMLLSVTTMACSGFLNEATTEESYHLTGGVAATVDGVNITEDTLTKQIMSVRTAYGYGSDGSWAQYLVDNGLTPETYREQVIDSYANQYLQTQAINEYDASATDEEVESAWNDAVENSGGDEESFIESLAAYGYTESSYKESLRNSLELDKLRSAVASVDDPTDQEVVDYLNENLSTYNDARRSSNILI